LDLEVNRFSRFGRIKVGFPTGRREDPDAIFLNAPQKGLVGRCDVHHGFHPAYHAGHASGWKLSDGHFIPLTQGHRTGHCTGNGNGGFQVKIVLAEFPLMV
jgi:hypothetical protein